MRAMLHLQPIPLSTAFIKGYLGIPCGLPARSEGAARAKLEGSDPEEIRGGGKEPFAHFQKPDEQRKSLAEVMWRARSRAEMKPRPRALTQRLLSHRSSPLLPLSKEKHQSCWVTVVQAWRGLCVLCGAFPCSPPPAGLTVS